MNVFASAIKPVTSRSLVALCMRYFLGTMETFTNPKLEFFFFLLYKNTVISSSGFLIICNVQKDTVRHSSRFPYGGFTLEVQR